MLMGARQIARRLTHLSHQDSCPSAHGSHLTANKVLNSLERKGRKTLKRYGLIITCLSTRAVHIEVLDDISTDPVIDALRRLIAIRGQVRQIRSHRGTNFVGASRELARTWKEMDRDSLKATLLEKHQYEWVFNPPAASHAGGVWERIIRSARRILDG
ncbi:Gag-pol fusion polyprotein [Elysia marginata]|uniref:Gag-pol fusion polyprotein n=1 Tax=Elysia marginata TaxID=1093978 RepID=A0AAV4G9F2_9GAST|nr:Gag-pol fusion polyprotein [Elysia marginata]